MTPETRAWREAARIFATPWEHRTYFEKKTSNDGLCHALDQLGHKDAYDAFVAYRDEDPAIDSWAGWWWPIRRKGGWQRRYDDLRATFAGLMAAMTQRERDRIVEGL